MKRIYQGGLAALLVVSVSLMVGCGADTAKSVDKVPVSAPSKATPKIIVTTETPSDSVRQAAPSSLNSLEQKSAAETQCTQDTECVTVPTNPSDCEPCGGSSGQVAVNITAARSIMGPQKDTCTAKDRKQAERNKSDESCKFNWASCVEGSCQLANLTKEQMEARMKGMGQGGPQGGGLAPNSSLPVNDLNGPGFGRGAAGADWGRNGLPTDNRFPGADFGRGGAGAGWGRNGLPTDNRFPGADFGRGGAGAGWDRNGFAPGFDRNPQDFGTGAGFNRGGNSYPGFNPRFGSGMDPSNSRLPYPAGYDRQSNYPGLGTYGGYPNGNANLGNFPGADRNFGAFPGGNR